MVILESPPETTGGNNSFEASPVAVSYDSFVDSIYSVEPTNWYRAQPYGFVFWDRATTAAPGASPQTGKITFWLPIAPENINIVTHYATNVVTTLYGVIEEHSEVRYYDITISGTTGYAPKYFSNVSTNRAGTSPTNSEFRNPDGRRSFESGFLESVNFGGVGAGAIGALQQAANTFQDTANLLTGVGSFNESGIDMSQSGYVAFHNLYRFFLVYKKDAAGRGPSGFTPRSFHPLQFLNYKDGNKYDCVPQDFTLTRSAQDPMLYNYSIKLRAFNLRSTTGNPESGDFQDAFLASLGLGGGSDDILTSVSDAIGDAVDIIADLF